MPLKRSLLQALFGLFTLSNAFGQHLSFSPPANFLPEVRTNKAIDITTFKRNFFVTWNDVRDGSIHVAWLGRGSNHPAGEDELTVGGAQSNFAPVLRSTPDYLYVFWIAKDGSIQYAVNTSDSSFAGASVHELKGAAAVTMGITAAFAGGKIVLATHGPGRDGICYVLTTIGGTGSLDSATLVKVPGKSADFPFVVPLSDSVVRLTWRSNKDDGIYYADAGIAGGAWTSTRQLLTVKTTVSPAAYRVFDSDRLFYIWKGRKSDNHLYYATEQGGRLSAGESELPSYFSTLHAVSICNVDRHRFALAYVGADDRLYLSYFTNYNPAKWMEESFYPRKAGYSLKDIVVPGAHDAGMSVLTATGGQQNGTINECNTLTQFQDVRAQLDAGIRMFDLRVGLYNGAFYTKHCSSDCMADAIGGGYGERLSRILYSIRDFLRANQKETVLLTFSHFCEKEASAATVARYIADTLGRELIFVGGGRRLTDVTLAELAGKVVVVFEQYADKLIDSCSIAQASDCFINFRRAYAATNVLANLESKEKAFFAELSQAKLRYNDLVRLDWQLTQSSDEAAMICNDFQSEKINPLINGAMLLTNVLRNHHSIKDLSQTGNKSISLLVNQWIADGNVNRNNKPNILYVDVAGGWITDYCVQLNDDPLYVK